MQSEVLPYKNDSSHVGNWQIFSQQQRTRQGGEQAKAKMNFQKYIFRSLAHFYQNLSFFFLKAEPNFPQTV